MRELFTDLEELQKIHTISEHGLMKNVNKSIWKYIVVLFQILQKNFLKYHKDNFEIFFTP